MKIVTLIGLVYFSVLQPVQATEPVPDKLVVLTFDDAVKSQFTVVRPLLKKHGFGATFFITEGFGFTFDKQRYMTWDEIAQLHRDGFEIGNHTRDHVPLDRSHLEGQLKDLDEQLNAINEHCREHGIPKPVSFAYPGNGIAKEALPILKALGIKFARRGGAPEYLYKDGKGFAYEPGLDHPLLIPSAGDARPSWTLDDFQRAVEQARFGRIAVLQFHGVPDEAHPWVNTPVDKFEEYMQYLADHDYTVIALRDLEKYVDPRVTPKDPFGVINDRKRSLAEGRSRNNFRPPQDDADLKFWLENMVWYHRFTVPEIRAATGLSADAVTAALQRFDIRPATRSKRPAEAPLLVLPYPGGRHPRIGFLDGAIRPQRETKLSVFLPWDETGYVVLDLPEAIRRNNEQEHGLLYLAHTHVPTMWTKQGMELKPLEWERQMWSARSASGKRLAERVAHTPPPGTLLTERRLPNGVVFGTKVIPGRNAVRMEMWLTNGSQETLSNLRVQNCVMFKGASEFAAQTNDNKVVSKPYVACRSANGDRWVITAWEPCHTAWANADCPCMHSDPTFGTCAPGETKRLRGWLSFYQGTDVQAELRRIDATGWREP